MLLMQGEDRGGRCEGSSVIGWISDVGSSSQLSHPLWTGRRRCHQLCSEVSNNTKSVW